MCWRFTGRSLFAVWIWGVLGFVASAQGPLDQSIASARVDAAAAAGRTGSGVANTKSTLESKLAESKLAAPTDKAHDPLRDAILKMARDGYAHIRSDVRDYTCVMVKRERVHGKLSDYQFMSAKVRHQRGNEPFSVYLKFLSPIDLKGREVLYVAGANEGKLIARKGGLRFAYVTTELEPTSELAMEDNRYPITEFGIENLVKRLLEHLEAAVLDSCTIQTFEDAKVDGRSCLSIQITNNLRTANKPISPTDANTADSVSTNGVSTNGVSNDGVSNDGVSNDGVSNDSVSNDSPANDSPSNGNSPANNAPAEMVAGAVEGGKLKARFHIARVYIDNELNLPIHYEAFDWPKGDDEEPRLLEQYTYRDIKVNVGLTEQDFQRTNPAYGFRK